MSTTSINSTQSYQPIPSMDNPAMTRNDSGGVGGHRNEDNTDVSSVESGGLVPSTYSSQQLMPPDNDRLHGGSETQIVNESTYNRMKLFTVCVLCFVNLINYMDRFTIAGVLTDIQVDFSIGDSEAGLLQTAFIVSYMLFAPIFGYLGDRHSRRWIMVVGVALWSSTTLVGSFMTNFNWFISFRALVGIGEASYSTIAPTIISDLFVGKQRSKMLAVFYFAIPVGSGLGYIVGSETAQLAHDWRWALRVTPILGVIAVALIMLVKDPVRGESEGSHTARRSSYTEDVKYLMKNRSFMFSTAGFTCVAFVTGALAWWGPKFIHLGLKTQPGNANMTLNDVSYKFGIVAMLAGLIGVPMGAAIATRLRPTIENCDPYICAVGLLISSPFIYLALVLAETTEIWCFIFVFVAQIALNLCWSIVADILLYVIVPNRRSTAEAFQILFSHALGDAGSPFLVGVISEAIKTALQQKTTRYSSPTGFESLSLTNFTRLNDTDFPEFPPSPFITEPPFKTTDESDFTALQYALFITSFVEVLGGVFFLITSAYIVSDKNKASQEAREIQDGAT